MTLGLEICLTFMPTNRELCMGYVWCWWIGYRFYLPWSLDLYCLLVVSFVFFVYTPGISCNPELSSTTLF